MRTQWEFLDFATMAPCIQQIESPLDGINEIHSFVLKHGRSFQPAPLSSDIARGRQHECYKNAATLAYSRHDLTYVEGVARGWESAFKMYPPLGHAWCVDRTGAVVDPTWSTIGIEYFGIPFKTSFVREFTLNNGRWTILDARWFRRFRVIPRAKWYRRM